MTSQLSKLIWEDDITGIKNFLQKYRDNHPDLDGMSSLNEWDHRGNPPLHLALMLGRLEAAKLLLDYGASATSVNSNNWTALHEAASLGNREILERILKQYWSEELSSFLSWNGPWEQLNLTHPKFYLEIELKLKSPVPILASICPRETLKIWKVKDGLRMDFSIEKISGLKITRSKMTILANFDLEQRTGEIFVINHDKRIYEPLLKCPSRSVLHDMVDTYLRDGICVDELPISNFKCERIDSNFMGMKKKKSVEIGKKKYHLECYKLTNLGLNQKFRYPLCHVSYATCDNLCRIQQKHSSSNSKRVERKDQIERLEALQFISGSDDHFESLENIQDDDFPKRQQQIDSVNKIITEKLSKISLRSRSHTRNHSALGQKSVESQSIAGDPIPERENDTHIQSFPPPISQISMKEYFSTWFQRNSWLYEGIGRECVETELTFERKNPIFLYQSKEFPLKLSDILPIIEWIAKDALQDGNALKRFLNESDMAGFPVKVEIPLLSLLTLKTSVTRFEHDFSSQKLSADHFKLPKDYEEAALMPLFNFRD